MIGRNDTLTAAVVRDMVHWDIILWGDDDAIPGMEGARVRWIAFADGGMWRIRYGYPERDSWWIIKHGNVLGMVEEIRRLVPCDEEAFNMYRF